LAGALKICETAPAGTTLLCMLPDTGERYLSTPLFEGVNADMSDEELKLSRSTPSCRFDHSPQPPPPPTPTPGEPSAAAPVCELEPPASEPVVSDEVRAFVDSVLSDREQPLVLFALEWCEFCWSLRKLFSKCEIPYRSIDLDSTAYQKHDRGGQIRAVLRHRTGSKTIPQVFVGGVFIGGCTETFDALKNGSLRKMLKPLGIEFAQEIGIDPYSLLPGWLHPR
jgi:cysteine synthase A